MTVLFRCLALAVTTWALVASAQTLLAPGWTVTLVFIEMLGLLQKRGLAQAGGGPNLSQAHVFWLLERHGLRIVLLR